MPTAYISLHTDCPEYQIHHEVSYLGYSRVALNYEGDIIEQFKKNSLNIFFPPVLNKSNQVLRWVGIGMHEKGQGPLLMRMPSLEMMLNANPPEMMSRQFWADHGATESQIDDLIEKKGPFIPHVILVNEDARVEFPADLNPIARTAYSLHISRMMNAADLPPRLYEAINDELQRAGMPIIPITRMATAKIEQSMSKMKSLNGMFNDRNA